MVDEVDVLCGKGRRREEDRRVEDAFERGLNGEERKGK